MDIVLKNIDFSFDNNKVFENFSFTFKEGTFTFVTGSSGSGKSTLCNIILGLLKQDAGEVTDTRNIKKACVFQENRLCEALTPLVNVSMVMGDKKNRTEAKELLKEAGITEYDTKTVSEYSGGEQRRIAIVRALIKESKIIVFDEALKGLDDENRSNMISMIKRKCNGKTVIFVTHDPRDLEAFNGDILKLN